MRALLRCARLYLLVRVHGHVGDPVVRHPFMELFSEQAPPLYNKIFSGIFIQVLLHNLS